MERINILFKVFKIIMIEDAISTSCPSQEVQRMRFHFDEKCNSKNDTVKKIYDIEIFLTELGILFSRNSDFTFWMNHYTKFELNWKVVMLDENNIVLFMPDNNEIVQITKEFEKKLNNLDKLNYYYFWYSHNNILKKSAKIYII
jgi:hypothetical protein